MSETACGRKREREKGLRREDILHAVPLVCVMVLKGCVLVLLTVMVVGVELNSPCQPMLVTHWTIKDKHTTPLMGPYHSISRSFCSGFIDGGNVQYRTNSVMMTPGYCFCKGVQIYTWRCVGTGNCFSHYQLNNSDNVIIARSCVSGPENSLKSC